MYRNIATFSTIFMIFIYGQKTVISAKNNGYEVTQDDLEVTYQNEEYVEAEVNVTNAGKTTSSTNANLKILKTPPSNLIVKIFISKEENGKSVPQTAVPIRHKICQWIKSDKILYPGFAKHGKLPRRCPISPGNYFVENYVVPVNDLPPMPAAAGKYKLIFDISNDNLKILTITCTATLL